jgi:hypothetical protein
VISHEVLQHLISGNRASTRRPPISASNVVSSSGAIHAARKASEGAAIRRHLDLYFRDV